jgi:S-adenosylmethionine:tRNA ribosyltransferase-isomerase
LFKRRNKDTLKRQGLNLLLDKGVSFSYLCGHFLKAKATIPMSKMKLSDFNFNLPEELIAEYPSDNRDESRMMVIHRETGKIEHKLFKDIINYFDEGDVMIMNNTRVFPARMYGNKEKTGAKIEVFLLRELNRESLLWDVLVDPARKIRIGNKLYFGDDDSLVAEVIDNTTSRGRTLRFLFDGPYEEFKQKITELGETPLPKYIKREVEPQDEDRYQTIFAKVEGAVAAPTAGLHFSRQLLKRLELKGINFAEVTLHVGLGTFRSVEVEDLTKHKMDSEQVTVSSECTEIVNHAKRNKRKVCAIGTTSMRSIETSVSTDGMLKPFDGWTNKFIFPPYEFSIADCMVTNFHTPLSTLLMMISAFCGHELMMEAYKQAVENKYRFYSYGDAMLIL